MSQYKNAFVLILCFVLAPHVFGQSNAKILGTEQEQLVFDTVLQYKNDCAKQIDPSGIQDKFAKQMAVWKQEQELCDCGAERLRTALTSHLLSGARLNTRDFLFRWNISDRLRCEMPHVGKRLQQNCGPLLAEYLAPDRNKYSNLEETVKVACTCISEAIAMDDVEQGVRVALEQYEAVLEAKKLGKPFPRARQTVTMKRLGECMSALEQKE